MTLRELAPGLWILPQPLTFFGLHIGVNTTLVRRPDGTLWVHSPGPDFPSLEGLDPVSDFVAPNAMHHMNLGRALGKHPEARATAAPGVERKHPDLRLESLVGKSWGEDLLQTPVDGMGFLNEFAFFHAPSATLIVTDLAFNLRAVDHWLTRTLMAVDGVYGRFGCPRSHDLLLVRDRKAYRRSLERVMEWPFERIIVGHGAPVEANGRELFARAFRV